MKKTLLLAGRSAREILRDPLNLAFGLGFPLAVILLLTAIQANVPVPLFRLERLTPGIAVFALSFMTLFSAQLVAKDRESAFLQRLYTAPLAAWQFILGYALPMLPIALAQAVVCYLTALALGLEPTVNILWALLLSLPATLFFVALGVLCGSVLSVKAAGGLCGALLTNLTAFLSGAWFDLDLVGGAFRRVAEVLPFVHAVDLERAALAGNWDGLWPHLAVVLAYAAAALVGAAALFLRQMDQR